MVPDQDYLLILANVSKHAPREIDAQVFGIPERAGQVATEAAAFPPPTALWRLKDARLSRVGIRITAPLADPQGVAARIAAIAVERQILPVFLNHSGACEMQRFGFRVEQVAGVTQADRDGCEEQIRRFWNMAMIVDAADVEKLG